MDQTQCSMWVAAPPPRQGPLVRGLTIAFNMYVHVGTTNDICIAARLANPPLESTLQQTTFV